MLPVPGGFAAAAGGRGGAEGCGELQVRSDVVPGVVRKLQSCLEAGLVHWSWGTVFWVDCGFVGLSGGCSPLGCLWVFLWIGGSSVRVESRLDWGGMGSGVRWLFLVFLG